MDEPNKKLKYIFPKDGWLRRVYRQEVESVVPIAISTAQNHKITAQQSMAKNRHDDMIKVIQIPDLDIQ